MRKTDKNEDFYAIPPPPKVRNSLPVTVRLDYSTIQALDQIALFEHEKRAAMCRRILLEKIQVYFRYPAFLRFKKQLEEKKHE
jgi:hypothetical protein